MKPVSAAAAVLGPTLLAFALAGVAGAQEQPILPVIGSAPGSQTGDGGVFTGLASTPEAKLFTGTATTSVRLELPPGRRAMTPQLALVYSSRGGASGYGYGWDIPIPRVSRSTRYGVPHYDDNDLFVIDMPSGRVELDPVPGTTRYRARVEGAFLRVGFDRSANYWKVIDKSGTTLTFGPSPESRLGPDVHAPDRTYAWLLHRCEDSFGNTIDYRYLGASAGDASSGLPLRISWGGNSRASLPHFLSVEFSWATRPYPSVPASSFSAGFRVEQRYLLDLITSYADGSPVRSYRLSHDVEPASGISRLVGVTVTGYGADRGLDVTLPSTVFEYAPALQLGWPLGSPAARGSHAIRFPSPGPLHDSGGRTVYHDTLDINGDALIDYVDASSDPPSVRLGNGSGFSGPVEWSWPGQARFLRHTDEGNNLEVNVFDVDGDRLPDLVDAREFYDPDFDCYAGNDHLWCVYLNNGRGFEATPLAWPAPENNIRFADDGGASVFVDVVDLNGDGLPDWAYSRSRSDASPFWRVHWNNGSGFDEGPSDFRAPTNLVTWIRTSREGALTVQRTVQGLADMNADGLPDLVVADPDPLQSLAQRRSEDHWQVYLNTGSGFSAQPTAWRVEGDSALELPNYLSRSVVYGHESSTTDELLDLSGDGRPDLLLFPTVEELDGYACEQDACTFPELPQSPPACCLNHLLLVNTGSSFSLPEGLPMWSGHLRSDSESSNPSLPTRKEFDLFDFDGDGLVDLVERHEEAGQSIWQVFPNPASPRASGSPTPAHRRYRPNLLLAMMNGVGAETHLSYAPLSLLGGGPLPFAYWVVDRRGIYDGLSSAPATVTNYLYSGAYYAAKQREFRGFAMVWAADALGRTNVRMYHQDYRRKGLLRSHSVLGNPGCSASDPLDRDDPCSPWNHLLREDLNLWPPQGPALLQARVSTPWHNGVPMEDYAKRLDFEYDAYGNVTRETVSSPSATTVVTETAYAYSVSDSPSGMPDLYVVDRVRSTSTRDPSGPLAEKRFAYSRFSRGGALTEASSCMSWSGNGACQRWSSVRYKVDKLGNVQNTISPTGTPTRLAYDDHGLYVVETTTARRSSLLVTSLATGKPELVLDPNGASSGTVYDGVGRPLVEWSPPFDADNPERWTSYVEAAEGRPGHIRTDRAGRPTTVTFFDGLGRKVATKTRRETADGVKTIVSGLKHYDSSGLVIGTAMPFESPSDDLETLAATWTDAPAKVTYGYDAQGRLVEQRMPDGSVARFDTSTPFVTVTSDYNLNAGEPGVATIEFHDAMNRVWKRQLCSQPPSPQAPYDCPPGAALSSTSYAYDGLDRLTSIVVAADSAAPSETVTVYDGLGNRVRVASDNRGSWSYEYDAAGLLVKGSGPGGATVLNSYNKTGQLRRQKTRQTRSTYRYHRRPPAIGLLRRVRTKSGSSSVRKDFDYGYGGRLTAEHYRIKVAGGRSVSYGFTYDYDSSGRRTAIGYPGQRAGQFQTVHSSYNASGLPDALWTTENGSVTSIIDKVDYDIYDQPVRIDYANGVSDLRAYSSIASRHQLRCMRTATADSTGGACDPEPGDLMALGVSRRDHSGRISQIEDALNPPGTALSNAHGYSRDSLGRITTAAHGWGQIERFEYDAAGRMTTNNGRVFVYGSGRPQLPGSLGNLAMDHDAAGNLTRRGDSSYGWDDLGRLREVAEGGTPSQIYHYDEGLTRVAALDLHSGKRTLYLGGYLELQGAALVRHYYLGTRLVASQLTTSAPQGHSGGAGHASPPRRSGDGSMEAALFSAAVFATLLLPILYLTARAGAPKSVALVTVVVFATASLPLPAACPRALALGRATSDPPTTATTLYYHPDHLGSTATVTNDEGLAVEHIRYATFGAVVGVFDAAGERLDSPSSQTGFAGHGIADSSKLQYFGSRYYDPDSAMFISPDPQAQFASPYLYGGGDPATGIDGDGEWFLPALLALLPEMLWSAALSGLISGLAAVVQGSDITSAMGYGFVGGAMGAGLGSLLGSLNVLVNVELLGIPAGAADAAAAMRAVAERATFTTVISHAAASVGQAAGLDSDWVTAIAVGTALLGSYAYDNFFAGDPRTAASLSERGALVKANGAKALDQVATTATHANVTVEAGGSLSLARAVKEVDGIGSADRLWRMLNNQRHFGSLSPTRYAELYDELKQTVFRSTDVMAKTIHYAQDYLTLGHMVPGTSVFVGPVGAPIRFAIHQLFGGEVALRQAQLRITRWLLSAFPEPVPI
ncbi:MAG: SpvB/TcaC N-terminal domain-containing protein [Candidatus Binatia bacterium]